MYHWFHTISTLDKKILGYIRKEFKVFTLRNKLSEIDNYTIEWQVFESQGLPAGCWHVHMPEDRGEKYGQHNDIRELLNLHARDGGNK